jgi:S1-C subfamily serine protease
MPTAIEDTLRAGQWVISIGSPLSPDFKNSVTMGVVSAIGLDPDARARFLLTDAALNPGNTGGPLINARGQMVGMASVSPESAAGFTGLERMIPVAQVVQTADALIEKGEQGRPHLGVEYGPVAAAKNPPLNASAGAARIVRVEPGSAAEEAGLQQGDIVLAVNDSRLESHLELSERIAARRPGDTITLTVQRGEDALQMEVRLRNLKSLHRGDGDDDDPQKKLMRDMGFTVENLNEEMVRDLEVPIDQGVVVLYVNPSSKSYREGDLRGGMIIVEMADQKIRDRDDFMRVYNEIPAEVFFLVMVIQPQTNGAMLTALVKP